MLTQCDWFLFLFSTDFFLFFHCHVIIHCLSLSFKYSLWGCSSSTFPPLFLSCIWFLILPNLPPSSSFSILHIRPTSNPSSKGPIRRQGSGSCPGVAGPSGWRRWCWGVLRCHTPSPFTPTLVPLSASTASACSRVSFAKACSVKVGLHMKRHFQRHYTHNGKYYRCSSIQVWLIFLISSTRLQIQLP